MNDLFISRFFGLLTESSPVSNEEMKTAYEHFLKQVLTLDQSETDYSVIFRTLNLTRIELNSLQAQILYEEGKKCPQIYLFKKSISFCHFGIKTLKSQNSLSRTVLSI